MFPEQVPGGTRYIAFANKRIQRLLASARSDERWRHRTWPNGSGRNFGKTNRASKEHRNSMCLAVPGKIISIDEADATFRSGRVDFAGIMKTVNLSYVPEAVIGNYVVVHVGFALSIVDEKEAQQVFEYLRQMDELTELTEAAA